MLALVAYGGLSFGLTAAGILALVVALPLALARGVEESIGPSVAHTGRARIASAASPPRRNEG